MSFSSTITHAYICFSQPDILLILCLSALINLHSVPTHFHLIRLNTLLFFSQFRSSECPSSGDYSDGHNAANHCGFLGEKRASRINRLRYKCKQFFNSQLKLAPILRPIEDELHVQNSLTFIGETGSV